jgi:uncharacterized RDD family membrane protein YckC
MPVVAGLACGQMFQESAKNTVATAAALLGSPLNLSRARHARIMFDRLQQPDDDFLTGGVLVRRIIAWMIDLVAIAVIAFGLAILFWMIGLATLGLGLGLLAVLPLVPFLYHVLSLLGPASATPGQQMLGLVVRRNDDFGPPTWLQAIICVLVYYATMMTSGLLLLVALFTARRRTLHDLLSGLIVIRADALEALTEARRSWNMGAGSYPRQFGP